MLFGKLAVSLLRSALKSNESWRKYLMLPYNLTNFETQKCYQDEPRFNGVYSRNNLS